MTCAIPAYILAGGQSRRFGSDKALAQIQGRTLLARNVTALQAWTSQITIVARKSDQYAFQQIRVISDIQSGLGPLGGLFTALTDATSTPVASTSWILMTSCDLCQLQSPWLDQLLAQAQTASPHIQAVIFQETAPPTQPSRWQPFPGLYHTSLLPMVQTRIEQNTLALWSLLESISTLAVPIPKDWPLVSQINTVADWEKYRNQQP